MRFLLEQRLRHQDEPWRAEAALQPALRHKGLLHGMQDVVLGESLDGNDVRTIDERGQVQTSGDSGAVDEHGAAAAESLPATLPRAEQRELSLENFDYRFMHGNAGGSRTA